MSMQSTDTHKTFTHQAPEQLNSTYRVAGFAGEDGSSLGLVHVEVLEVGLVNLPGQGLLVSQLGVFHLPVPRHHLRLQLQLL